MFTTTWWKMMMVHSHKYFIRWLWIIMLAYWETQARLWRAQSDVLLHYKHVHAYKKRKMQCWTTTAGQCLFKARNECNETVRIPSVLACTCILWCGWSSYRLFRAQDGVFEVDEHPHPEHLQGIEWIYESPCLKSIVHIQFSPYTVISNHALAGKICKQIQNTFAQVMPERFNAQVIEFYNKMEGGATEIMGSCIL